MKANPEAATPTVSVIVPVYNGAATIAACVESLLALDYPEDRREIIVVDNRSTDDTRSILARYPIVVLAEDDVQSSYAARNRGVAASRGEYLAFTDADCVADRRWLRGLIGALQEPEVGGVAGAIEALQTTSAVERYQATRAIRAERAFAHTVLPFAQTANAGYKRPAFERIGGFDPSIVYGGDLDFSWRMQHETGLRLVYERAALIWHQHRTTHRGLFKLYEKNAIANCLLAKRYEHYAGFPQFRTFLYLIREAARAALRVVTGTLRSAHEETVTSRFDAVCYAGAACGWLRWHWGIPPVAPSSDSNKGYKTSKLMGDGEWNARIPL